MTKHIIWDWNCTLFDDFPGVLRATSQVVESFGGEPVTVEQYHQTHTRPFRAMYSKLLGRQISDEEDRAMRDVFWNNYKELIHGLELRPDAQACVTRADKAGFTQSVLSVLFHEQLIEFIGNFSIAVYMIAVRGAGSNLGSYQKEEIIEQHLEEVNLALGHELEPREITMVGDAANDAVASRHVGINSVLVTGGMDSESTLRQENVPVAHSLTEALDMIGVPQ